MYESDIVKKRISLGMSQRELAKRAGVSHTWVSMLESNTRLRQGKGYSAILEILDKYKQCPVCRGCGVIDKNYPRYASLDAGS